MSGEKLWRRARVKGSCRASKYDEEVEEELRQTKFLE